MIKSKINRIAIILLTLIVAGCTGNEFLFEFALSEKADNTYKVLYYASDAKKGWVIESVVELEKGKGEFKGVTHNPTLVYVFKGSVPALAIYSERGDKIKVSGKDSDPALWTVEGNEINESMSEWRLANKVNIERRAKDDAAKKALNKSLTEYVKKNCENPASALLLQLYYDRSIDEAGFIKAWKMLKGEASENAWRELVSRSDMFGGVNTKWAMPKRIVLTSVETGCDTIEFGKKPILMYITRTNVESYREDIRKMREVVKEHDDSTKRIIANILLEPDSMARWQAARADSLTGVVEGWVPLGISDPIMRDMAVRQIPYTIVLGKDGKVKYRGEKLDQAIEMFRKEMR